MFPRFYPIVSTLDNALLYMQAGVTFLQLRLKNLEPEAYRPQIEMVLLEAKKYDATVVINDFWQEAIDLSAPWVHLGQEDLQIADIAAIKKAGIKLGISTHNIPELDYALSFNPDYIALGPIYPTQLKSMVYAPQGLDKIAIWKEKIGALPLVAIGGITLEKANAVWDAGADCISVVTDIEWHENKRERLQAWIACKP